MRFAEFLGQGTVEVAAADSRSEILVTQQGLMRIKTSGAVTLRRFDARATLFRVNGVRRRSGPGRLSRSPRAQSRREKKAAGMTRPPYPAPSMAQGFFCNYAIYGEYVAVSVMPAAAV